MKKILPALAALLLPAFLYAQTYIPGGWVTNSPWTAAGSPYIIQGSITAGTLVIQPGVDVRFQNGNGLTVYTALKAVGTAAQPIIFEADDTTNWSNFSNPNGGMGGIYIQGPATDTSIMDHCIVRDAKSTISNTVSECICAYTSPFILSNSEVYHNYMSGNPSIISISGNLAHIFNNKIHDNIGRLTGGINLSLTNAVIEGNEFYNNYGSEGGAIYCSSVNDPVGPTITNNYIHHNHSDLDAGGIYIIDATATVSNNVIAFNKSARAGSGVYVMYSHVNVLSNWICNNTDTIYPNCGINDGGGGLTINNGYTGDTAIVINNIIANNNSYFSGGGIRMCGGGGTAWIENNDIVNNTCKGGYFTGGVEFVNNCHASLRNNLIWGNRATTPSNSLDSVQIIAGANDTIAIENCAVEISHLGALLVNTGTIITGNQATNMGFYGINPGVLAPTTGTGILYDATVADWHLTQNSLCINTGSTASLLAPPLPTDVYGSTRIIGSHIDIGAVEYPVLDGIASHEETAFAIFPNPATDVLHVNAPGAVLSIRVSDLSGKILVAPVNGKDVDVSALAPGIYFVTFEGENGALVTEKFVKE